MATPKPTKFKTNTLKKSTTKKSSGRKTTVKKGFTSRVGLTKLSRKSFLKPWMAIPAILLVALAGYAIVQFSDASGGITLRPNASSNCKTVSKSNGRSAIQCVRNHHVDYSQRVNPGTYRVCYRVAAYTGVSWVVNIKGLADSSWRARSDNDATKLSCTHEVTMNKSGTIYSQLITTSNGTNNDKGYYGTYIYTATLTGSTTSSGAGSGGGTSGAGSGGNSSSGSGGGGSGAASAWINAAAQEQRDKAQCLAYSGYTSSYTMQVPNAHGYAKSIRKTYWDRNKSPKCRNKFWHWDKSSFKCNAGGYVKTGELKCERPRRLPWAFCKDKNRNNCIKSVFKEDSNAIYSLRTCDLRMHAGYHSYDKCKDRKGFWKRP